jgi:tetratricopeptide (TPR) repeat protein
MTRILTLLTMFFFSVKALCATFSAAPVFSGVELNISVPSGFTNYIERQSVTPIAEKYVDYKTNKPSSFYSAEFTTSLASVFTGEDAYRNHIVNLFLEKKDADLKELYPKYKDKLLSEKIIEEVNLLYSVTLINLGSAEGYGILKGICLANGSFYQAACDKYTQLYWEKKDYEAIIRLGRQKPFPRYTFSALVLSNMKLGRVQEAKRLLDNNPDMIFYIPDFNDMRIIAEYYNGYYARAANLRHFGTDNLSFILSDSLINIGELAQAGEWVKKVAKKDEKLYLNSKIAVSTKNWKNLKEGVKQLKEETLLHALLQYYFAKTYPNPDFEILDLFSFKESKYASYPYYYSGLALLKQQNYADAAFQFGKVRAPENLKADAIFYRGISLIYVNPKVAESDIITVLNTSQNEQQTAQSRYMLAQTYYLKEQDDEALQLLDGCYETYCRILTGEIHLKKALSDETLEDVQGIENSRAALLRAAAYYNIGNISASRQELALVESSSNEVLHLKLLLSIKEKDLSAAREIILKNRSYKPILFDGIKAFYDAGDYKTAETIVDGKTDLPPEVELIYAHVLAKLGQPDKAKIIYEHLLSQNGMVYGALDGLLNIQSKNKRVNYALGILEALPNYGDFPDKDKLLVSIAQTAIEGKDNILLTRAINAFFPEYESYESAGDMFAARANLFFITGRFEECLNDIKSATAKNASLKNSLYELSINCGEKVKPSSVAEHYMKIFNDRKKGWEEAGRKVVEYSENAADILKVTLEVKESDEPLYTRGLRKYALTAGKKDLDRDKAIIDLLCEDMKKRYRCAGRFARARSFELEGKLKEAAKVYEEVYEVDPRDELTMPALRAALRLYEKLNMNKSAERVKKRIK